MTTHRTYDIYYDEEGDFLEITLGEPSKKDYAEEVEPGVFIIRDESSNLVKSIGILSFKKRSGILKEILEKVHITLPLEIRSIN